MLRSAMIACLLLTAALPVAAQNVAFGGIRADTSAPVEMSADNLSVNQADGSATFTGNVTIAQGEMKLQANEVTVIYAEGGQQRIKSLRAVGQVTLVSGPDAAEASVARCARTRFTARPASVAVTALSTTRPTRPISWFCSVASPRPASPPPPSAAPATNHAVARAEVTQ